MTFHQTFCLRDQLGEPRIRDLDLANRLGFSEGRQRDVRQLIERNAVELETYAEVCVAAPQTSTKGGRPGKEYWLTEGQALVICALSRTPRAAVVRKLVIEVFMEWRREQERKTVHVREHNRRPPIPSLSAPVKIPHSVEIGFTVDPDVMQLKANVPAKIVYDFMSAFAAYQQTVVSGMRIAAQ